MITLYYMMVIPLNHIHWEGFAAPNHHIQLLPLGIRCSWSLNQMPLYRERDFSQATPQVCLLFLQSSISQTVLSVPQGVPSNLSGMPSPNSLFQHLY